MPDKDNMNIFKCHCNYHLGMGPNLQCPLHGSRENLFAGVVSRRNERERTRLEHLGTKDDLERDINRLNKLLTDVERTTSSRVIKAMIKLGLEAHDERSHPPLRTGMAGDELVPYELGSMTRVKESVIAEMEGNNRATINGIIILTFGGVIIGGLLLMLFHELGWIG